MNISIIGAGHIGGTLTRRLTALGHQVCVANSRGPETLADLARETGARAVTAEEAVRSGDLVILTIPMKDVPQLPKDLFRSVRDIPGNQLIVVETCNYYPQQRDGRIDAIEAGMVESRWVEEQIGRPVIKAFNNIYADHLMNRGKAPGTERIALPVAGDDARTKAVVMKLVDQLGFDAVDGGPLDQSWRQQPGKPVYGADLDADGVRQALADARAERDPEWRAQDQDTGVQDLRNSA